jgi:beta-phosphoglucomutase
MAERNRRAVIWDVDGTLVDTADQHFRAWERVCGELGRPFTRADFAATFGWRNPEIITQLFGTRFNSDVVDDIGRRKEEYYRAAARENGVQLLPGVRALLEGLKAAGFAQAVGSSAPPGNLELLLALTQTADFFAAVVSGDDVHRGKPDPEVFQLGADRLGVPASRCVVMEDAVAGVQASRAAGMKCVAVTFVGHHPADKLRAAGADRVVRTLEEVTAAELAQLLDPA